MARSLLPVLLLLLAGGCTRQRIDASSEEMFEFSYQRVRASLEPERRERFEAAVRALGVADLEHHSEDAPPDAAARSIMERLDGKTAAEIIREAEGLPDRQGG